MKEAIPAGCQSREVGFTEEDARQSCLLAEQELRGKDDGGAVVLGNLSVEEERRCDDRLNPLGFFCRRLDLDEAITGRDNLHLIALSPQGADQGHRVGHHTRPKI